MATTFYFTDTASDVNPTSDIEKLLSLSRGSGVVSKVTNTATGPVDIKQVTNGAGGTPLRWISNPLNAVTFGATRPTQNLRGLESSMNANVTLTCQILPAGNDGVTSGTLYDSRNASYPEVGTTEGAINQVLVNGLGGTIANGDRIVILVLIDDSSGATMASGFTSTFFYNGTTSGASGDSFITFAETITEYVAPSLSPPFNKDRRIASRRSSLKIF